jgi:hypothetical protein
VTKVTFAENDTGNDRSLEIRVRLSPEYLEGLRHEGSFCTTSAESEKALRLVRAESLGLMAKHDVDRSSCASLRFMHPPKILRRPLLANSEDSLIPSCCLSVRS